MKLTRRGRWTLFAIILGAVAVAWPAAALGVNGADITVAILVVAAVAIASVLD